MDLRVCLKNGNWPAVGLLPVRFVGPFLTARFGDARNGPPRAQPKSLTATQFRFFRQTRMGEKMVVAERHYDNSPAFQRRILLAPILVPAGRLNFTSTNIVRHIQFGVFSTVPSGLWQC